MDLPSALAAQNYAATRSAAAPNAPAGGGAAWDRALADFAAILESGEQTAMQAMTGDSGPHALVQALAQTELAVEAAVTVRDKVVEAYQEILRMPV